VNVRDLTHFAWTAVARHRLRSSLSLIGVAIGVSAVVMLTSLGEGARRYVTQEFMAIGANLVILVPGRNETTGAFPGVGGVPNDLTIDDVRALDRAMPSLQTLAPIAMGNETVANRERRRQVMIVGTTYDYIKVRELSIAHGRFLPQGELDRGDQVAVMGAKVARELFPDESPLGNVIRVGDWRMRVIGVIEETGTQVGLNMDDVVMVPLATGMQMFNRTSLFRVLLKTHSHEDMEGTCDRALSVLADRHGEEDVTCITQAAVVDTLSSILNALTAALAGIAAISLAVAGIGIMNLMLVSVSERTREIGLCKAVGARAPQILQIFLAEAIMLSVAGGIAGLTLGWAAIRIMVWVYPVFPAAMPLWSVVAALATAVSVGAVFGVLPARRATRLDPVRALAGK
jgi:putative ABC transport system permease protein